LQGIYTSTGLSGCQENGSEAGAEIMTFSYVNVMLINFIRYEKKI